MGTYTKSLATDFSGSIKMRQFHDEIVATITGKTLLRVKKRQDVVSIIFDTALSAGEETTLDNLISSHTPDTSEVPQNQHNIVPKKDMIKKEVYSKVVTYIYNPSLINNLTNIRSISYMENKGTSYDVRVYDKTHNTVIAEANFTNKTEEIKDL